MLPESFSQKCDLEVGCLEKIAPSSKMLLHSRNIRLPWEEAG